MSGNPDNVRQWADADVYVAFSTSATNPADIDTAFGAEWDLVGLLDGDAGFTETREEDTTDFYAWGGLLIRTARRQFQMRRGFTALETSSPVVDRLRYPGSTNDVIKVPGGNQIEQVKVAFEVVDRDIKRRLITYNYAEVMISGDSTESEQSISPLTFEAKIFPDASGNLFHRQTDEVLSS